MAYLLLLPVSPVLDVFLSGDEVAWRFDGLPIAVKTDSYGYRLPVVYGLRVAMVAALFPPYRRFAALKQRRQDGWLSDLRGIHRCHDQG